MKTPKKNLKRILMIATGGTIASKRSADGLKPLMTSEELLGFVPHVKEFCEVTATQVINIDSTNIQPKHWLLISSTIERFYDQYDGFVVCHGTDKMCIRDSPCAPRIILRSVCRSHPIYFCTPVNPLLLSFVSASGCSRLS